MSDFLILCSRPGLYLFPFGNIIRRHSISFLFYADDLQFYLLLESRDSLQLLMNYYEDIKAWMINNLKLQLRSSSSVRPNLEVLLQAV